MITIIFEAHGTTFDNEAHLSSGHNDVELSPLGIQQSKEMKDQWELKGNAANFTILKNSDHFSLLFHFLEDGEIVESIERLYNSTT